MSRLWKSVFLPFNEVQRVTGLNGEVALPFVVRAIQTIEELQAVARLRHTGYRLSGLRTEDTIDHAFDLAPNTVIFGAFDKTDQSLIGTIRVVIGSRGPVEVSSYCAVPTAIYEAPQAEARWFCVPRGSHNALVKLLLCKALYQLAVETDCASIVVAAKRSMQGLYRLMQFDDIAQSPVVFQPDGHRHAHTVLGISVPRVREQWREDPDLAQMFKVFFEQTHPDLQIPADSQRVLNPLSELQPQLSQTVIDTEELRSSPS